MVTEEEKEYAKHPKEVVVLEKGGTKVEVDPKGAMVKRFQVGGVDVFYPYYTFIKDGKLKERGGSPILFPSAGPPVKSAVLNLKQHGFGRNLDWELGSQSAEGNSLTLRLASNVETKKQYPYDFECDLTITVDEGKLRYDLSVTNRSDELMPIAPGFHPYFSLANGEAEKEELPIQTNIEGFDPENYQLGKPLKKPGQEHIEITVPSGTINLNSSPEVSGTTMLWSDNERYFCVEPWAGGEQAIVDPEQRIEVQPGKSVNLWMEIQFQKS